MGGPKWKREVIQDHKFDYIDVKSFTAHGVLLWAGYVWVYIDILKSTAVYVLDTQTGNIEAEAEADYSHFLISVQQVVKSSPAGGSIEYFAVDFQWMYHLFLSSVGKRLVDCTENYPLERYLVCVYKSDR